jgi:hypothetical protein
VLWPCQPGFDIGAHFVSIVMDRTMAIATAAPSLWAILFK